MARKVIISDTDTKKYGIRITDRTGKTGWIAGPNGDYLLFDSEVSADRALKKMKQDNRYSWNCLAEVVCFSK